MSNRIPLLTWLLLALINVSVTAQQIASTFDTGIDGWRLINDADNDTLVVVHNAAGYISGNTPTDNYPDYFWYAPAKFLGDLTYQSYGKTLSFDLQMAVTGNNSEFNGNYYEAYHADLEITNGTQSIYFHTSPKPALAPGWTTYTVALDNSTAWRNGTQVASALSSTYEIKRVLASATRLMIRANYNLTANTVGLDNVILGVRSYDTAPTVGGFSPASGLPGSSVTITGTGFDPDMADNEVYFGSLKANITSASATQLLATVPAGSAHGVITVINKTTGLVTVSDKSFTTMFTDGGRIIPASLDPKIELLLDATAGNDINGVTLADVDGDGLLDILVSERSINAISIFRNLGVTGDITPSSFAAKVTVTGAGNSNGLYLHDLDGDGKMDLIGEHSNGFTSSFGTFRNISTPGNIAFESVELWPGLVYSSSLAAVADFDGDGLADLAATHGNGSVSVDFWISQNISTKGNIEFSISRSYFGGSTLDAACGVAVGDLDNDGRPDAIVTHNFCGVSKVLRNTSSPGVISFATPFPITDGVHGGVNIADFNNDGKMDIAWKKGYSNDDVNIKLNNYTTGTLDETDFSATIIINSDLFNYGGMSVADFNGDGRPDILASDGTNIGIFENIYTGGTFDAKAFVPAHIYQGAGISTYPTTPIAGDLNGDQKPDLITGITNVTPVRIYIYENKNVHAPKISLNTVSPLSGAIGSTVTITGDYFSTTPSENTVHFGGVKATVQTATRNTLTVTVPDGATMGPVTVTRDALTSRYHLPFIPTFSPGTTFSAGSFLPPISFTLTTADFDIEVGDINNDGKPDVVAEAASLRAYAFMNIHTSGTISATSLVADDTSNTSAQNLKLIDIDQDGLIDMLTANGAYKNSSTAGEITFATVTSFTTGGNLAFGDFNLDGKMDAVGANGTLASFSENLSRPGPFLTGTYPTFETGIGYSKPAANGAPVTGDFDRDGDDDVLVTNPGTDNISVLENIGGYRINTSLFNVLPVIVVGDNPSRIYSGDLDLDGKLDVMFYYGTPTQFITVLHNQSTPGNIVFTRVDYPVGAVISVAHISDLDGDGKPEILATSEATDQFFILKNTSTPGVMNASSFSTPFATSVNNPRGINTGDLNLDGKPEIIITSAPNAMLVFENAISTGPVITFNDHPSPANFCDKAGSSATFTASASGTTNITYRWQRFNTVSSTWDDLSNNANYAGATTNTLTVSAGSGLTTGNYRAKASGDLAADAFSNPATLTINALPSAPGTTGASTCTAPASLNLTATGTTDGNYRWYDVANGGTSLGTNGIFTTPSISVSTTYYVAIANAFCESLRTPVVAAINLLAKPALSFTPPGAVGTINLCTGESQDVTAPPGFSNYTWSDGQNTQTVSLDQPGSYTVIVEDASGCVSPSSDAVIIVVNPFPSATITANGTQLTASAGDSYQWYSFDEPIAGATSQSLGINVLEYGVYAVDVTDNGCTTRSSDYIYLITGSEKSSGRPVNIHPNPARDKVIIETTIPIESLEMTDMLGRTQGTISNPPREVDVRQLEAGTYTLRITAGGQQFLLRMIKIQ